RARHRLALLRARRVAAVLARLVFIRRGVAAGAAAGERAQERQGHRPPGQTVASHLVEYTSPTDRTDVNREDFETRVLELWMTTRIPLTRAHLQYATGLVRRRMNAWLDEM